MDMNELLGKITTLVNDQGKLQNAAIEEQKKFGQATSEKLEKLAKLETDVTKYSNAYTDLKTADDELKKTNDELKKKLTELEAKHIDFERGIQVGGPRGKSLGETFTDSEVFSEMQREKAVVSRKLDVGTLLGTKDVLGPDAALNRPERLVGITHIPNVPLTVRALLPVGRTSNNSIEYVKEGTFTNNAGPQFSPLTSPSVMYDGALKRKSNITWTLVNTPVRTVAHYMKASRQILDDIPMLQSEINNRLLYGLAIEEEEQILLGDGANGNMLGIVPQAADYDNAYNAGGDTKIDKLRHALLQVTLSKYLPTAIVLNHDDWHDIELIKTTQGNYILSNPAMATEPKLWGYRVVPSLSMPVNRFLVGNFATSAQIFDRMNATVEIARQNEDDFIRNMITILAEERIALAVYTNAGFVEGAFV
jgi:HK97 family phage major capsid protein